LFRLHRLGVTICVLGDVNITRAAGRSDLIQMVGTNPSCSHDEIVSARLTQDQPLFFQFYKNSDDAVAEKLIRKIDHLGYNAIFLTVDAPVLGKRESDERAPFEAEDEERGGPLEHQEDEKVDEAHDMDVGQDTSVASAFSKQDDPDKTWEKVSSCNAYSRVLRP